MPHPSTTAETYPHKPAVILGASGTMVTYRQLDKRSNQGARLFRSLGLQAGDHIAMLMENNARFLEICWAAQRAGIIFTPVATHLQRDDIAYVLSNCGARLLVGSHQLVDSALQVREDSAGIEFFYMVGGIAEGFQSWEEAVLAQPTTPIEDEGNGVPMIYSAGMTGRPKGVLVPPENDDVSTPPMAIGLGQLFGFGEETVYLSPAPLYQAAPLHYNMMNLYQGGTSIIMEKFDPEAALALIEEHRVTHSQWVPIMFIRMLKLPQAVRERYDLSSMQFAIHAAAPCPVETKKQLIDWWGPVVVEYYAASEGMGATLIDSDAWLAHPGSVGRTLSGQVHILDDEGTELPAGETGTIYFSGDQARFEYHGEADKTAAAFNHRGWATTGDMGYLDEAGYLYLSDRAHFRVSVGGVNVYPQEIENLLITHDKVADAAVFGLPCEEAGEKLQALVQPMNWADATDETAIEIMEWLRERLSGAQLPKDVDFHPGLPRREDGNLYKRHLMDEYKGGTRSDDGAA